MNLPESATKFLKHLEIKVEDVDRAWSSLQKGDYADFYRRFWIQESDKRRPIDAPVDWLKKAQKTLLNKFFYRMQASPAAHGFVRNRSPLTNAKFHLEHRGSSPRFCVLSMDVREFFPSLKGPAVNRVIIKTLERRFGKNPLDPKTHEIAEVILALCLKDGSLPMGSPCSPAISNIIMGNFDRRITDYCRGHGLNYTRYADDITISGINANKAARAVARLLGGMSLEVNEKKTRVRRCHRRMEITGITINSGTPTVTRKYRRLLRAQMHQTQLVVERVGTPPSLCDEPKAESIPVLLGKAGWCASVSAAHRGLLVKAKEIERLASQT